MITNLEDDERVVFFTTAARPSDDGKVWHLPIHARVFKPERSTVRRAAIGKALQAAYGVVPDRASRERFDERINLLLGDNKGGRRIVVRVGGTAYALPATGADGHVEATLDVPADALKDEARAGIVRFSAQLAPRDPRTFSGAALLIARSGRSIISDIDDTVKITHVTDRKRMMEATFAKPFEAVPGLARVYQTWASEGATVHFISSSPWHLYELLDVFLRDAGFPVATMELKQIRLKDRSIQNLFADATKTKPPAIERLLQAYPQRTFTLIGDSGEKDPEIYADMLRRHPQRIERIFIRNVTGARPDDARFTAAFAGLAPGRWQLFTDATELPLHLRD